MGLRLKPWFKALPPRGRYTMQAQTLLFCGSPSY
jgi:hypothetical protein